MDDPTLSRLHARFELTGERLHVQDLGSRNGTWLAGKCVAEAALRAGDVLVLGAATVSVQIAPSAAAALQGLLTREALLGQLQREWTRAQSTGHIIAVVAARPLAKGTGAHGYDYAGACLRALQTGDRAAPHEQDALLLLLVDATPERAEQTALRIVASADAQRPVVCGIASAPGAASSPGELLSAAWLAAQRASCSQPVVTAPTQRAPRADEVVRKSPNMLELQRLVERVAPRPMAVLVTGETGAGKELVAHELHRLSGRSGPFKIVNCAAIPEQLIESVLFGHVKGAFTGADREHAGIFEQASKGSVFLDEVGELSAAAQAALLRVLDTRRFCRVGGSREIEVDVRVIAATHRNLQLLAEQGSFRLDLFHRLTGMVMELPPLRERTEELVPLVQHFMQRAAAQWQSPLPLLSEEALELLRAYQWPGNVRELRNVVERAMAVSDGALISPADLPPQLRARSVTAQPGGAAQRTEPESKINLRGRLQSEELALIQSALAACSDNQRKAAELLGIPLRTFERRLRAARDRQAAG